MISRFFFFIFILFPFCTFSQDSIQQLPSKYLNTVSSKAGQLQQKLDKKSEKTLQEMMKLETKMKRKLAKADSLKAKEIFGNTEQKYKELEERLNSKISGKQYIPSLDTLNTSLKFLQQNPQIISQIKDGQQKLKETLSKVNGLENQFQRADEIKKFLKERRDFLKNQLSKLGFTKELKKISKDAYYFNQQLVEYKSILQDKKKAELKALALLSQSKWFKNFMRRNSQLASLFRLPDPNDLVSQAGLAGLQTRAQVNSLIQQQITAGGPNAQAQFQQNIADAQSQISHLKNKISQSGGGSSDDIMPDGFKPNSQRTKSFWNRLEYGTNFQSQKATNLFPVTSDIGLSLGYMLSDKSVLGIGTSYKLGWGRGWNHIELTNQGIGLRSYLDWKIKGSFWISGGYEQNYKTAFSDFAQLKDKNDWQSSGLVGLSKIISLNTKFFKKTKLQLLWDFLSYQQIPKTQSILFRIAYNLK